METKYKHKTRAKEVKEASRVVESTFTLNCHNGINGKIWHCLCFKSYRGNMQNWIKYMEEELLPSF